MLSLWADPWEDRGDQSVGGRSCAVAALVDRFLGVRRFSGRVAMTTSLRPAHDCEWLPRWGKIAILPVNVHVDRHRWKLIEARVLLTVAAP